MKSSFFFLVLILEVYQGIENSSSRYRRSAAPIFVTTDSLVENNIIKGFPFLKIFIVDTIFVNYNWISLLKSDLFMGKLLVDKFLDEMRVSVEPITSKCDKKELSNTLSSIMTRIKIGDPNYKYAVIVHNCDMSCQLTSQMERIMVSSDLYISMCTGYGLHIEETQSTSYIRYEPLYIKMVPHILDTLRFLNLTCIHFVSELEIVIGEVNVNMMDFFKKNLNGCVTHEIFDSEETHPRTDKYAYNPTVYFFIMSIYNINRYLEIHGNTYFNNKKIILVALGDEEYFPTEVMVKFKRLLRNQKRSILLRVGNTKLFKYPEPVGHSNLKIDPWVQAMYNYISVQSILYSKDRNEQQNYIEEWLLGDYTKHPLQDFTVKIILAYLPHHYSKRRNFVIFQLNLFNFTTVNWKQKFTDHHLKDWNEYPTYKHDICGLEGKDCRYIEYLFSEVFYQFLLIVTSTILLVFYIVARIFYNYAHNRKEVQEFFIPMNLFHGYEKKSTQGTLMSRLMTLFASTASQVTTNISTDSSEFTSQSNVTTNNKTSDKYLKKGTSTSGIESSTKSLTSDQMKKFGRNKKNPEAPANKESPQNWKHITYEEDEIYLFEMPNRKIRDNAFSPELVEELMDIKRINHENLLPLVGININPPQIYMLAAKHGSLRDIIDDNCLSKVFNLNLMVSLLTDIAKGMDYLHNSRIGSHGHLRSTQCVIDDRWHCKISGYGLSKLRRERSGHITKLLYTSPELLRTPIGMRNYYGSRTGDVYSFAIILQEVILMNRPYARELQKGYSVEKILAKVRSKKVKPPFRPHIGDHYPLEWRLLVEVCWQEEPERRFTFKEIIMVLRKLAGNDQMTFAEALSNRLEQNAKNLGVTVMELTAGLQEASEKAYNLLSHLLPTNVADDYILGKSYQTEMFESVSIMCTDMKGFTKISSACSPRETIEYLNKMYSIYDNIIENRDAYKLETIGDAYIVISGCPIRNGHAHATEIAYVALHLIDQSTGEDVPLLAGNKIGTRVGVHSGPVFAGVVGLKVPKFCVFGTTYSTAEKMESSGEVDMIRISDDTHAILDHKKFRCVKSIKVETDETVMGTWFLVAII